MSNIAITFIVITSIIQSTHSLITSTNCGDLIITCQGDIHECCKGGCCALLNIFQNQNRSNPTPTDEPIEPKYTPKPKPLTCPKIGEQCSSQFERQSRCCGQNTKCRFENYNRNGLLGTCCVLHEMFGCEKDSDCCKYDGICDNGYCQRNLDPQSNTNGMPIINANTKSDTAPTTGVSAVRARGGVVDGNDKQSDLHERNRSKPNYEIWVSLTANTIILYLVLLTICSVFYCWYRKNSKMYERGKVIMNVRHIGMQKGNKKYLNNVIGINNMECDIDESDSTEVESDTDELPGNCDIYSSEREM